MLKRLFLFVILPFSLSVNSAPYEEGKHYKVLPNKPLSEKQEVVEFFSYSCPHCYHADHFAQALKKDLPKSVAFDQVPVGFFKPMFEITRIAAIVAKVLDKEDAFHKKMFERIHGEGGSHFRNEKELKAFFAENGVTEEQFNIAFESKEAQELHKHYRKATHESQISGVPSFIVRNKYLVLHNSVQNEGEFLKVVDYLLKKDDSKKPQ